jgi:hypothetical protein
MQNAAAVLQVHVGRTKSDYWHLVKNEVDVAKAEVGHGLIAKPGCASAETCTHVLAGGADIASPRALAFVVGQDSTFVRAIDPLCETILCWCRDQIDAVVRSRGENRAGLEDDTALLVHSVP